DAPGDLGPPLGRWPGRDLLADPHRLVAVPLHGEDRAATGPDVRVAGGDVGFQVLRVEVAPAVHDEVLAAALEIQVPAVDEAQVAGPHRGAGQAGHAHAEGGRGALGVPPVPGAVARPGHGDLTGPAVRQRRPGGP